MKGLNEVKLIGNVGNDPQIKFTGSGTKVATISIATNETWKDSEGKKQTSTEWHRVVAWKGLADIAEKYLGKGDPVYIEGKLKTRSYDKDGVTHYTTEIVAIDMILLAGKGNGVPSPTDQDAPGNSRRSADVARGTEITDEDIPF